MVDDLADQLAERREALAGYPPDRLLDWLRERLDSCPDEPGEQERTLFWCDLYQQWSAHGRPYTPEWVGRLGTLGPFRCRALNQAWQSPDPSAWLRQRLDECEEGWQRFCQTSQRQRSLDELGAKLLAAVARARSAGTLREGLFDEIDRLQEEFARRYVAESKPVCAACGVVGSWEQSACPGCGTLDF